MRPGSAGQDSIVRVVEGGFWIFCGNLIINLGGFIFWLVMGFVAGVREIGYATTAYSIAWMLGSLGNPGLNYAILRLLPVKGSPVFSTTLILSIILGLTLSLSTLSFTSIYYGFYIYIPLIIYIIIISLISNVLTSTVMALLKTRFIFHSNILYTILRLILGITLILLGFKGLGIVIALLLAQTVSLLYLLTKTRKLLTPTTLKFKYTREILATGLANYPQILATQLIVSSGVVLLAILSGHPETIGTFYITLMITLVVGVLPWSMTTLSLPAMVKSNDHSLALEALRIGCSITLPFL